jgi:hypothetical protein
MREKIRVLTAALEDTLGVKIVSHRAGRWAFNERYAEMLLEEGYTVDCSVTPLVSWATSLGDPAGRGGSDYTDFADDAYWVDLHDISQPGNSNLLEVPVTIARLRFRPIHRLNRVADGLPRPFDRLRGLSQRVTNRLSPAAWLRPTGQNGRRLQGLVDRALGEGRRYAELMLHSSELMPGGSPTLPDSASVEAMYADLELLFRRVQESFRGATLAEFHDEIARSLVGAEEGPICTSE